MQRKISPSAPGTTGRPVLRGGLHGASIGSPRQRPRSAGNLFILAGNRPGFAGAKSLFPSDAALPLSQKQQQLPLQEIRKSGLAVFGNGANPDFWINLWITGLTFEVSESELRGSFRALPVLSCQAAPPQALPLPCPGLILQSCSRGWPGGTAKDHWICDWAGPESLLGRVREGGVACRDS